MLQTKQSDSTKSKEIEAVYCVLSRRRQAKGYMRLSQHALERVWLTIFKRKQFNLTDKI